MKIKRLFCLLSVLTLLSVSLPVIGEEEEEQWVDLDEETVTETAEESAEDSAEDNETVFTPSYGSAYREDIGSAYWTTPMDISNVKYRHTYTGNRMKNPKSSGKYPICPRASG